MAAMDDRSPARAFFAALVSLPDDEIGLAHGALLIAQEEYPRLDAEAYLRRLDHLAERLRPILEGLQTDVQRLTALNRLLFEEEGFRGNQADYYDPRNSFLNDVLDRKLGIPITLSVVYMEVGWRVGLPLSGVGLPGHFMVRCDGRGGPILVDPFHRGAILTAREATERAREVSGQQVPLLPESFQPVSRRAILTRMLNNLKAIYVQRADYPRALSAVERLVLIAPEAATEVRDRGLLHYALNQYSQAETYLERYLWLTREGSDDVEAIQATLERIRETRTRLN
ncbi:MAG: transglutaminase family protein [Anaerolineae bacterium]|nr:transglutaminase family protein [Anaerolineae bacterium]